jgi:hypothetical protein
MTQRSIDELPAYAQEAVLAFAAKHGRGWKAALGLAWSNGTDTRERDGYALRDIRNNPQWGHDWLDGVKL